MTADDIHSPVNPQEASSQKCERWTQCKTYRLRKGKSIRALAHAIEGFLMYDMGMTCQVLRTQQGEYIVQGKDRNENIKQWVGLDQTITVRMIPSDENTVCVRIEGGKWIKKGAIMATGILFSQLLIVSSGYDMIRQALLPLKIFQEIERYLNNLEIE